MYLLKWDSLWKEKKICFTVTEENPKTYDGIMNWAILGFVSMSGIVGTVIYRKKQNI